MTDSKNSKDPFIDRAFSWTVGGLLFVIVGLPVLIICGIGWIASAVVLAVGE